MMSKPGGGSQAMALESLKHQFYVMTGLDLSQYKDRYLMRRLEIRMRRNNIDSLDRYRNFILTNKQERETFTNEITINVTHFFRDGPVFNLLEQSVLPLMIYEKFKKQENTIRCWNAGCSSGEEPYSLAIMFKELMGGSLNHYDLGIEATDIDIKCLTKARQGKYLPQQVEKIEPGRLGRYFDFDGKHYNLHQDIKKMVNFNYLDLFTGKKKSRADLIMCRNVIIYFSKAQQEKLFIKFHNALNDGGYLVLGKTETLVGESRNIYSTFNGAQRIFQKKENKMPAFVTT